MTSERITRDDILELKLKNGNTLTVQEGLTRIEESPKAFELAHIGYGIIDRGIHKGLFGGRPYIKRVMKVSVKEIILKETVTGWTDEEIEAIELLGNPMGFEGSTEDYNRTIMEHEL